MRLKTMPEGQDPLEELSQLASSLGLGGPETPKPTSKGPPPESARSSAAEASDAAATRRPSLKKLPTCSDLLGCPPNWSGSAGGTCASTAGGSSGGAVGAAADSRRGSNSGSIAAGSRRSSIQYSDEMPPEHRVQVEGGGSRAVAKAMVALQERVQALAATKDALEHETASLCAHYCGSNSPGRSEESGGCVKLTRLHANHRRRDQNVTLHKEIEALRALHREALELKDREYQERLASEAAIAAAKVDALTKELAAVKSAAASEGDEKRSARAHVSELEQEIEGLRRELHAARDLNDEVQAMRLEMGTAAEARIADLEGSIKYERSRGEGVRVAGLDLAAAPAAAADLPCCPRPPPSPSSNLTRDISWF